MPPSHPLALCSIIQNNECEYEQEEFEESEEENQPDAMEIVINPGRENYSFCFEKVNGVLWLRCGNEECEKLISYSQVEYTETDCISCYTCPHCDTIVYFVPELSEEQVI